MSDTRTCANCACSFIREDAKNPLQKQMFCRLNPPVAAQLRGEKPRMRDGKVVIGRDNKPVMENVTELHFLYAPTLPELVCFNGWRPMGVLPGVLFRLTDNLSVQTYVDSPKQSE